MGQQQATPIPEGKGYRILSVQQNSPCSHLDIQSYLDLIVDIRTSIDDSQTKKLTFFEILQQNENYFVSLMLYNIASKLNREITVKPSLEWQNSDSLLGLRLRYEDLLEAQENVFKITKVFPRSPAEKCGLNDDCYILTLKNQKITKFSDLTDAISACQNNQDKQIAMGVYFCKENRTKTVTLKPDSHWGGEGTIGCEIGVGVLNQISLPQESLIEQIAVEQVSEATQKQLDAKVDDFLNSALVSNTLVQQLRLKKQSHSSGHSKVTIHTPFSTDIGLNSSRELQSIQATDQIQTAQFDAETIKQPHDLEKIEKNNVDQTQFPSTEIAKQSINANGDHPSQDVEVDHTIHTDEINPEESSGLRQKYPLHCQNSPHRAESVETKMFECDKLGTFYKIDKNCLFQLETRLQNLQETQS